MRAPREKNFTHQVCERLTDFAFNQLRLTPKGLADLLGCDQSMVYRIKRGESLPDVGRLVELWSYARNVSTPLNFEWLLTGQASLGMMELSSTKHAEALSLLQQLDERGVSSLMPVLQLLSERLSGVHHAPKC